MLTHVLRFLSFPFFSSRGSFVVNKENLAYLAGKDKVVGRDAVF